MIALLGRVLRRDVLRQAGTKVTATAKDAADSAAQTAAQVMIVGRSAAGGVGQVTADAVVQTATRVVTHATDAVSAAGAVTTAVGREASTIANTTVGAVGHAVAAISSRAAPGWSQKSEIKGEKRTDVSSYVTERIDRSASLLRSTVILGGVWFVALASLLSIWIYDEYRVNSIVGMLEIFIFLNALFIGFFWLCREIRAWRNLVVVENLQRELSIECHTEADEARFRAAIRGLRRVARNASLIEFIDGADLGADTAALRQELEQIGLREVDARAIEAIRRSSRDVFFLSLLSTNALIDTAAFSIRALGMIRHVAAAYGHRPGRIGILRLARHILADITLLPIGMMVALEAGRSVGSAIHRMGENTTKVGATVMQIPEPHHMIIGAAFSTVGAVVEAAGAVAETLTPRVADAALAAGRMGHLGLLTIAHVRPVALSHSRYGTMRSAVLKTILGLRNDANRQKKELRA